MDAIHDVIVIILFFGGIGAVGYGFGEWFSKDTERSKRGAEIMIFGSVAGILSALVA